MIKLETAQDILLKATSVLPAEKLLLEHCWQRVLAEDVIAGTDFPPFDRSPLDGYAVIAAEVTQASRNKPVRLRQIEDVPAGNTPIRAVSQGTAIRIMTGAPIPQGATGVVRLEDVVVEGDTAQVLDGSAAAANICHKGEEIRLNEVVLSAGTVITAGVMGLLAMLGVVRPKVYRQPRVAILATGSEIIPAGAQLAPGKIRNSNTYMVSALVQAAGGLPVVLGEVPDSVEAILKRLAESPECDMLITTGGASVGDYDLIGKVYEQLGIELLFDRVSMKPGMPVLAGLKDGKMYLGLSGNPASAAISYDQLVRPVILKLGGRRELWRPLFKAVLAAPYGKSTAARRFVWAACHQGDGAVLVDPIDTQGNGMLRSSAAANCLIAIPENTPPLPAGTVVDIILLAEQF